MHHKTYLRIRAVLFYYRWYLPITVHAVHVNMTYMYMYTVHLTGVSYMSQNMKPVTPGGGGEWRSTLQLQ